MTLKLKLKVNSSKPSKVKNEPEDGDSGPRPKLKIKQPSVLKNHNVGGVTKPKVPKDKLKKLKISLGKAQSGSNADNLGSLGPKEPMQPILRKVPKVRIKPTRVPGEGYDSEAPDIEDDPLLEQAIAVRFLNDANLDFLHSAADTGDFSNVNIKWITRDKAVVNVNLTLYSARLIDMPTLTELYKTVDKKNIFKTIDVSQILLVLRTINPKNLNMELDFEVPDEYTYTHPLYKLSVNKEIRPSRTAYKHGLSNSFEDVYRRFKPKKVNHRLMTDIELRVDEIVRRDNDAEESHYEYVNPKLQPQRYPDGSKRPDTLHKSVSSLSTPQNYNGSPEPGSNITDHEPDDVEENESDQMALDLEADLDIALEQELADALDSTSNNTAATVLMKSEYGNEDDGEVDDGAVTGPNDDDDDENEDDEEEEEDDEDEEDDDAKQDKSKVKKLEEEIGDLQKAADKQKVLLATASYKMMRMKFQSAYNNLKSQLDLKKRELAKIREQQTKQQLPAHRDALPQQELDDDEEDEEEEEDEGEGGVEALADAQTNYPETKSATEAKEGETEAVADALVSREANENEHDEEMDDANEEDNYDDFQGLF